MIGVELPETDYELLDEKDKQQVEAKYKSSKTEILALIDTLKEKGYRHGVAYLENLSRRIFTNVELWLKTGVIAPKTTSMLERIFREIGRRIKRIAYGWADKTVSKLSKMIVLKKYSKEKWEQYWKQKLGIEGNFSIEILQTLLDVEKFFRVQKIFHHRLTVVRQHHPVFFEIRGKGLFIHEK